MIDTKQTSLWTQEVKVASTFSPMEQLVVTPGDCLTTLRTLPVNFVKLIVTSPPYNLGKVYEQAAGLEQYLAAIEPIVAELVRVLATDGSLCWQVGNYVEDGEVFPLDIFTTLCSKNTA